MRLILVRHGETMWNLENRILGHTDVDLTEKGRKQAERLGVALKDEEVTAIYSSSLRRARETANEIVRYHNLEVIADDAFMELDAGDLDGLTFEEVMKKYGEFLKEWANDASSLKVPGGESIAEVQRRAWSAVNKLVDIHADETVIVVSHSLAIQSMINKALEMNLSNLRRLRLDLASISILNFGKSGISLLLYNDTCHLENGV